MINKLYIVLVNFNGYQDTIECLESIFKQDNQSLQVILVDNSNSDTDLNELSSWSEGNYNEEIKTNFPSIVFPLIQKPIDYAVFLENQLLKKEYLNKLLIVKAEENKGFAAANNIALRYIEKFGSLNDFIWLLNNDTIIDADTIGQLQVELIKNIEGAEKVLFGTPLMEYYEPQKTQAVGGKYNKITGITSHLGEKIRIKRDLIIDVFAVDYPIGASMIISSNYLKKIGLMNEEYFLFFEELDWAERTKKNGGSVHILSVFTVYHKQGKSTKSYRNKQKSEFIDLLSLKNRLLFCKRYYKKHLWSVKLFILSVTVFRRLISGNFNRIPKIIKLVFTI